MQDTLDKHFSDFKSQPHDLAVAEIKRQRLNGRFTIALELIKDYKEGNGANNELELLEKSLIKDSNNQQAQLHHWMENGSNDALYPKGVLGTREGVQSLVALQNTVMRGVDSLFRTPIDFACELSLIVRDDFQCYLALKEIIQYKISRFNGKPPSDLISVELICELYDEQADIGSSRFLSLLSIAQPWQLARILRTQKLKKTSIFITNLARKIINNTIDYRELSDLQKANLIAISYPVLPHAEYRQLCASMAADAANYNLETAAGWTKTWVTAALNGAEGKLNTSSPGTPKKLNIALCVSGQLRGFRNAHSTWKNLGLENHNVDTYVHTWKNIGVRFPDPNWRPHVERRFKDQKFITSYIKLCANYGIQEIQKLYPSIFSTDTGDYVASEEMLKEVYGENCTVKIDDETDQKFSAFSNQDKMYYKIMECFKLATRPNKHYDLVIKIRPDILIGEGTTIDWENVYKSCYNDNIVFSETPPLLKENIFIGDQIGISTLDIGKTYSECYLYHEHAKNQKILGVPGVRTGHYTLAWTLLLNGIKSEQLKSVKWGGLSDVQKLDNEQILDLIERDIGSNSSNFIHQDLLAALGSR